MNVDQVWVRLAQEYLEFSFESSIPQRVSSNGIALIKVVDDGPYSDAVVVISQSLPSVTIHICDACEGRYSVAMDLPTCELPGVLLGAAAVERRPAVDDVKDR